MWLVIACLVVYAGGLMLVSYLSSAKESEEDFLIAGRNRRWVQLMLSKYAGSLGAGWFVAYTAFAYEFGLGILSVLIGLFIGYIWFALWGAPRIKAAVRNSQAYTQGDFVFSVTQSLLARRITNGVAALTNALWLLVAIVGGAKLIEYLGLVSYELALIFTIIMVFAYLLIGGFKAVIITDVIQSIILFGLLLIVGYGLLSEVNVLRLLSAAENTMSFPAALAFILLGTLGPFSSPDRYQLTYAGQDAAEVRKGFGYAYVPIILSAFVLLLIGLYMRSVNPSLDPGVVFSEALKFYLPETMLLGGVLLFFVALMSSADTNIYSLVSHTLLNRTDQDKRRTLRKGLFTLAVVALFGGLFMRDIYELSVLTAAVSLIAAIPCIYLIAGGKDATVFLSSIAGGATGIFIGIMIAGLEPEAGGFMLLGALLGLLAPNLLRKFKS